LIPLSTQYRSKASALWSGMLLNEYVMTPICTPLMSESGLRVACAHADPPSGPPTPMARPDTAAVMPPTKLRRETLSRPGLSFFMMNFPETRADESGIARLSTQKCSGPDLDLRSYYRSFAQGG
ncbi:MAG: hypothetical protein ACXW3V_08220, partial [Methylocystis sp.]